MESELSNTVTVVGNYNSVPTSITSKVLIVTMLNGLSVIKTADKLVWSDGDLTYTIKVINQTDESYTSPVITDVLDNTLIDFVSDSVTIDGQATQNYSFDTSSSTLTITLPDIESKGEKTVTFKVTKKS